jgi:hypothetical protein
VLCCVVLFCCVDLLLTTFLDGGIVINAYSGDSGGIPALPALQHITDSFSSLPDIVHYPLAFSLNDADGNRIASKQIEKCDSYFFTFSSHDHRASHSLVVASKYQPSSVVLPLLEHLKPSSSIAVFSHSLQV